VTAAVQAVPAHQTAASQWGRKYPPLAALAIALAIAMVVLPSSLNLPQSNPSTTLEFAPVPPDEDTPPDNTGNLSSLGLATSEGLEEGGLPGGDGEGPGLPPPDELPGGIGKSPSTKRCVDTDRGPRQTEDPLAPPCVAHFEGDNFGATYQGVTGEEVRVLFYLQGFTRHVNHCENANQVTPDGKYFDLAEPPEPNEHCLLRILRTWQQYFNERFQTYNRFVHFYAYYSGQGSSAEERKADAAENFDKVRPFSVVTFAVDDHLDAYMESMARRGVVVFDAVTGRKAEFFQRFPSLIWGYYPSLEQSVKMYTAFLCKRVAGQPVVDSGSPGVNGQERKYGLIYTSDAGKPELRYFKDLVVEQVARCGIEFSAEGTFPSAGYFQDNRYPPTYAETLAADFQSKDITTIIWPGGYETQISKSMGRRAYYPEIILAGDLILELEVSGTFQDQEVWRHAWVVTNVVAQLEQTQRPCYIAFREADPNANHDEARSLGCDIYASIRQVFTGIQVAGPRLNPETVDQGFHAIPAIKSESPYVPACFYEPGDYTCIKDGILETWDPSANDNQGCYRMFDGGLRYFAAAWPEGNLNTGVQADDPCNAYDGTFVLNPAPPSPNNL